MLIGAGVLGYKMAIHPTLCVHAIKTMESAAFLGFIVAMVTIFK